MIRVRAVAAGLFLSSWCFCFAAGAEPPGKWKTRAPLPSSRTEAAAAEIGGKIYVIGGYGKNGNLVEAYDPQKDRWERRASLPKRLHHTGAAAVNGKLYIIGGYISGTVRSTQFTSTTPPSIAGRQKSRCVRPVARLRSA